jgi:hypothetical protein
MRFLLLLVFCFSLYGADSNTQIYVDSRQGSVYLYLNGKLIKTQNILTKEYRLAVANNTLDVFWNVPEIKANADGTLPIPIKVAGFKHVNQIGGTCNEASYREWCVYFAGELLPECPALKDVGLFNTAVMQNKFTVSHANTLARARVGRDGIVDYSGSIDSSRNRASGTQLMSWLKKYMNISMMYHNRLSLLPQIARLRQGQGFPVSRGYAASKLLKPGNYTHLITQQLLLGHGLVAYCKLKSGGRHALNLFGTDGKDVYVSTWGRVYKGEFPRFEIFSFYDHISVLLPRRSEQGEVTTGLAGHIGAVGAAELFPIRGNNNSVDYEIPFITFNELRENPAKYKNKEIFLYGNLDKMRQQGFRVEFAKKEYALSSDQYEKYMRFKNNIKNEFIGIYEEILLKSRRDIMKGIFRYDPQAHSTFMLQTYFKNCVILDVKR